MTENREERIAVLEAQALTLRFLSGILLELPSQERLTALAEEGVFDGIPYGGGQKAAQEGLAFLQRWSQNYSEEEAEKVYRDGMRLFVGPTAIRAPLWESVYLNIDHLVFQEETLQVRLWYQKFGLESKKKGQEPDDHIGLEMEFLAALAEGMAQCLKKEDEAGYHSYHSARNTFLEEHLLKWYLLWYKQVEGYAETDFYRGIARLVRAVIAEIAAEG